MKRLRLVAVTLVVLVCATAPARADEASKREKIHQMFAMLHMDRITQQITDQMMKQVSAITKQMGGGAALPADVQQKLDAFQKKVFDLVNSQVSWDKMEPEYTELYAQAYTEQELDDILTFYRSPSGAAMIEKTPELLSKSMALSQEKMQAITPQLMQMLQDFVKDMGAMKSGGAGAAK